MKKFVLAVSLCLTQWGWTEVTQMERVFKYYPKNCESQADVQRDLQRVASTKYQLENAQFDGRVLKTDFLANYQYCEETAEGVFEFVKGSFTDPRNYTRFGKEYKIVFDSFTQFALMDRNEPFVSTKVTLDPADSLRGSLELDVYKTLNESQKDKLENGETIDIIVNFGLNANSIFTIIETGKEILTVKRWGSAVYKITIKNPQE